ncbi:hypothetical protein [Pseudoalteromonas sp. NZS37]|uniref:hypothetical protein n=1 Tax=Pseudoalteromonas sp. NZS37 TaxID=2792071 RepID=UPI0018CDAFCA|nr:hypothetical protein [Pseudoalteromonas sp. NZS37]MBG9991572.1 hypothetical protein [Pseudoalteromonas sp. NZS37]
MSNQPLSVVNAIESLVSAYNHEVAEFDQMVTEADQLQEQNDKLNILIKDYEQGAAVLLKNLENAQIKLAQANRERDHALTKNQDANITLAAFKEIAGTPKKLREKVKSYKERLESQRLAAEQQKRKYQDECKKNTQLKEQILELENRLDVAAINQIYRNDNDIIQTYPYHLGGMVEGHDEQQTPLLYLNQSGRGGLILLNKDDEAELVEAPKGGLRPKKETLEHCGKWLRRAKANGWQTDVKDIKALANSSD